MSQPPVRRWKSSTTAVKFSAVRAGDHADDQLMIRVEGHVVPTVPLAVVGPLGGIAGLRLLGDEGPLLVAPDLMGPGGNRDEFVVQDAVVLAGQPAQAADGVPIHRAEASGLADATALGDVLQDRFGLAGWQSGVEQRRPWRSETRAWQVRQRSMRRSRAS